MNTLTLAQPSLFGPLEGGATLDEPAFVEARPDERRDVVGDAQDVLVPARGVRRPGERVGGGPLQHPDAAQLVAPSGERGRQRARDPAEREADEVARANPGDRLLGGDELAAERGAPVVHGQWESPMS